LTPDDLALQIARLEDAWGAPRDRSPAQFVGMTREWFNQLQRFGVKTVERAVTHVIGSHKFGWANSGPLPEIVMFCTKDDRDWREIIALDAKPFAPPPEQFEREGRTVEEEIQHRAAQIAEMKKLAGLKSHAEVTAEETQTREPKQASLDMHVSAHLLNTCAARRARKLETCSDSCARQRCELRERAVQ
jgi:hypothetical protein